jgi:hypothetical protein
MRLRKNVEYMRNNSKIPTSLKTVLILPQTIFELISKGPDLTKYMEKVDGFLNLIKSGYKKDSFFLKIVKNPKRYSTFEMRDNLPYT